MPAPGPAELLGCHVEHTGDGAPAGGKIRLRHGFERGIAFLQQRGDGGSHMLRQDPVKQREVRRGEQGIGHKSDFAAIRTG